MELKQAILLLGLAPSIGCYSGVDGFAGGVGGATGGPSGEEEDGDGNGDGDIPGDDDDPVFDLSRDSRMPRLSHLQWENTVRDLLLLDEVTGLSGNFVDDPSAGGFDNQGASYEVGATLWSDYQRAAEGVADLVAFDAERLARIVPPDEGQSLQERARAFIEQFGLRAYRRPLTADEVDAYRAVFADAGPRYEETDAFQAGVHLTVQMMLQSPHFLYRVVDGEVDDEGKIPLDGFERASRLSYALWNTMPDEALFDDAAQGRLDSTDGLMAAAERMLAHPYARVMVDDFHSQLLKLDAYLDQYRDPDFFPDFDPAIGAVMQQEAKMFIRDVIFEQNQGYTELLTSTRTFVNDQLAEVYGLPGGLGPDLVEVELDPTQRSGLLTRSGFLMSQSQQVDPDPIHRGAFISFELMCNVQPPIPDNVSSVEPDPTKTNRERVDAHTGKGTCGEGCHTTLINDPGFAFEGYDATGKWRTVDNGKPIDSTGTFDFDGEAQDFEDAIEFSQRLADSHQAHACYSRHMLEYLHGRRHREGDEGQIDRLGELSVGGERSIRGIIVDLVTSDEFVNIRDEEQQ